MVRPVEQAVNSSTAESKRAMMCVFNQRYYESKPVLTSTVKHTSLTHANVQYKKQ